MGETEAIFRQQEVLGPLRFGTETEIIIFLQLGQTFFILWFTDIFAPYAMSGFGIKIKIKFQ